jgi:hypothetical protein
VCMRVCVCVGGGGVTHIDQHVRGRWWRGSGRGVTRGRAGELCVWGRRAGGRGARACCGPAAHAVGHAAIMGRRGRGLTRVDAEASTRSERARPRDLHEAARACCCGGWEPPIRPSGRAIVALAARAAGRRARRWVCVGMRVAEWGRRGFLRGKSGGGRNRWAKPVGLRGPVDRTPQPPALHDAAQIRAPGLRPAGRWPRRRGHSEAHAAPAPPLPEGHG